MQVIIKDDEFLLSQYYRVGTPEYNKRMEYYANRSKPLYDIPDDLLTRYEAAYETLFSLKEEIEDTMIEVVKDNQ